MPLEPVKAGVRKQRGGVAEIAVNRLGRDQRNVERNADRERSAEAGRRMDMRVARTMTVVVVVTMIMRVAGMVMMTVMVVAAQF